MPNGLRSSAERALPSVEKTSTVRERRAACRAGSRDIDFRHLVDAVLGIARLNGEDVVHEGLALAHGPHDAHVTVVVFRVTDEQPRIVSDGGSDLDLIHVVARFFGLVRHDDPYTGKVYHK